MLGAGLGGLVVAVAAASVAAQLSGWAAQAAAGLAVVGGLAGL